jgi:hypothetical protein
MKNVYILGIILLICISCKSSKNSEKLERVYVEEYGKPLVVLLETNPWLMVIGSDSPSFVLYDNGVLIYSEIIDRKLFRKLVVFNQNEMNEFIEYLSIDESIYDLDKEIISSEWTDQPTNIIYLNIMKMKKIMVYGRVETSNDVRNRTPDAFINLYDKIKHYRKENSFEWMPPKIEVMFWDYNYAPKSRKWIEGFPDLNSQSTINRGGDSYSIFIEGDEYELFIKYFKEMGEKEAVEINGRKMAISYRIPFPNIEELKLLYSSEEYEHLFY